MFQKIIDNHLENERRKIESSLLDFSNLFRENKDHLSLIVENWEIFNELLRVPNNLGGLDIKYRPDSWGSGLIDQIGWIKWFITHEMLDNGEPRVIYYRRPNLNTFSDRSSWVVTSPDQATGCSIIRCDSCDYSGDLTTKSFNLTVDQLREAILFQKKRSLMRETVTQWRNSATKSLSQLTLPENEEGIRLRELLRLIETEFSVL